MMPIEFEGSRWIGKPKSMTDEDCAGIYAATGVQSKARPIVFSGIEAYEGTDQAGYKYWLTAWKPSKEDLEAMNRGEPFYLKTLANGLPPMFICTFDEKGELNV